MKEKALEKILETVAWLIPPACREEVLGDLRERHQKPARFLFDAASVIPCVIYSRIRRTTDPVLIVLEWMTIYAMLVFATLWVDRAWLFQQWSYLRLAVPPTIIAAVMTLEDAYADPRKRRFDPVLGPGLGLGVAAGFAVVNAPGLPTFVFTLGAPAGALIVATLRVLYPPEADRPVVAKIPAFWQRLELIRPASLTVISIQAALFLLTFLVLLGRRFFGF